MSRKTVKRKTNIALSVDVSLNLHESKSTNQNRVCRKRKQFTKSQYSYSESDISEAEFDQSCCRGKPKSYKKKMYTEYPQKKHERQLMRPWLVEQVNKGDIPGLEWLNKDKTLIKIPWTHASRHGWDETRDSDLFRKWAQNTGKYSSDPKDKNEDGNPKKWKANFRCGMNSLPDIREEKNMSQKKGSDAYKVYRLLTEKVRGQPRKRCNTAQSESSDSDHHYKKYVTKADRLERHKSVVVKEKIKQKIEMRKQTVKAENESLFYRSTANHYDTKPQIPLPVCTTSTNATQPYYEPQQYHSYTSSDSEERSPHQVQQMAQPLNLQTTNATNRPRYTSTQSVDREIEVTTTFEPEFISRMNDYHEHSYALNRSDNTIPSLVQDFETEPDSDYGSTSPSSSPGSQEERIAQPPMHISQDITPRNNIATLWDVYSGFHKCISDLETTYSSNNATDLFSPTTPSMNQEPMFGCHFNPAHSDPRNSIYKRSESMELYSVPGTTFDQSFPMTGDMPTGTPIQMDTDPTSDRPLQFSEY